MAHIRIEMDRGNGWEVRGEGDYPCDREELMAHLPNYAIQYDHRAFLDGVLVGECAAPADVRKRRATR